MRKNLFDGVLVAHPDELSPVGGKDLLAQARNGRVIVIDMRPERGEETHPRLNPAD